MSGELRELKPGEVFYFFNEKLHFIGIAQSDEDCVYVFWAWNARKRRRYYCTIPLWAMKIDWEYFRKTKKRVK